MKTPVPVASLQEGQKGPAAQGTITELTQRLAQAEGAIESYQTEVEELRRYKEGAQSNWRQTLDGPCSGCGLVRNWSLNGQVQAFCATCARKLELPLCLMTPEGASDKPAAGPSNPPAVLKDTQAPEGRAGERWHDLKCWPEYFRAVRANLKPFELRKDDRPGGYQVGDVLRLREFEPASERYSGEEETRRVGYVLRGPSPFGLRDGHVILGFASVPPAAGAPAVPTPSQEWPDRAAALLLRDAASYIRANVYGWASGPAADLCARLDAASGNRAAPAPSPDSPLGAQDEGAAPEVGGPPTVWLFCKHGKHDRCAGEKIARECACPCHASGQPTAGPSPSIPASPVPATSGSAEERLAALEKHHHETSLDAAHDLAETLRERNAAYAQGLERAAELAKHSSFVDGPQGTVEGQIADAIRALAGTGAQPPSEEKSK